MKVRFTPSARADFLAALEYIRAENPAAAARFRARVDRSMRRLARFPDSGSRIPEFPELPHRQLIVQPYRFLYRVERKVVWIVAAGHGARLPSRPS